jgi:hypothetical protein
LLLALDDWRLGAADTLERDGGGEELDLVDRLRDGTEDAVSFRFEPDRMFDSLGDDVRVRPE